MIITIDGPSGAGKGTLAARLAKQLGWHLLDSGALYRLTALAIIRQGIDIDSRKDINADTAVQLAQAAAELDVEFVTNEDGVTVLLQQQDVSQALRTEKTAAVASIVAAVPAVRQALLTRQRAFAQPPGLIADGRDMGTVVFPTAALKLYLTASAEQRAHRRVEQLKKQGLTANLPTILQEIEARDHRDTHRDVAPLLPADDAHEIDTSELDAEAVYQHAWTMIQQLQLT